jgi:hypothetical protein
MLFDDFKYFIGANREQALFLRRKIYVREDISFKGKIVRGLNSRSCHKAR